MTFSFHPEAELEFNQAIDYYEECQPNLGLDFVDEVIILAVMQLNRKPDYWLNRR